MALTFFQTDTTYFTKMQKCGKIRRVGPDKGGHWEVVSH